MRKKKRNVYSTPTCKIIQMEASCFICNSITPHGSASTTVSWGTEEEHEGGTISFGDETTIAPSKKTFFGEEND